MIYQCYAVSNLFDTFGARCKPEFVKKDGANLRDAVTGQPFSGRFKCSRRGVLLGYEHPHAEIDSILCVASPGIDGWTRFYYLRFKQTFGRLYVSLRLGR